MNSFLDNLLNICYTLTDVNRKDTDKISYGSIKMNSENDVRWLQRFDNYKRALEQLNDAIKVMNERSLSNLEKQGLVQAFEFTHELSWKVLKDFLEYRGATDLYGSRDVVRRAFSLGLLDLSDYNKLTNENLKDHINRIGQVFWNRN